MNYEYYRGDVWYANIVDIGTGVQRGIRPVVIIQNDKANLFSPVVTVLAITTKCKELVTHVEIHSLSKQSWVLAEQVLTISKENLIRYVIQLSKEEMRLVDQALDVHLAREVEEFDLGQMRKFIDQINSLTAFMNKNRHVLKSTKELENAINFQMSEMERYCSKFGINYKKFCPKNMFLER